VLATGVARTQEPTPDEGEVLEVHTTPLADIRGLLRTGQIDHALVVVAFGHLAWH
jgi:hypothetical protein